jgi:hypothetical protein
MPVAHPADVIPHGLRSLRALPAWTLLLSCEASGWFQYTLMLRDAVIVIRDRCNRFFGNRAFPIGGLIENNQALDMSD